MSEIMDRFPPYLFPEDNESYSAASEERASARAFELIPFDPSNFPEGRLAMLRADTATRIKESLQDYTRLEGDARQFREVATRGDYIWAIISDLGMTKAEMPTKQYREAFTAAHERAKDLKSSGIDIWELQQKYDEHPALDFIDTLTNISPNTTAVKNELVYLRRSLLVLLDEHSQ